MNLWKEPVHRAIARVLTCVALGSMLGGCGSYAPGRAAATATGLVSHQLCSAVFVSGLDPEEFYREAIEPMLSPAGFLFSHTIDREHAQVTARVAGVAESRAVHRAALGCVLVPGALPAPAQAALAAPAFTSKPAEPEATGNPSATASTPAPPSSTPGPSSNPPPPSSANTASATGKTAPQPATGPPSPPSPSPHD